MAARHLRHPHVGLDTEDRALSSGEEATGDPSATPDVQNVDRPVREERVDDRRWV
jgi:hypothetical protein